MKRLLTLAALLVATVSSHVQAQTAYVKTVPFYYEMTLTAGTEKNDLFPYDWTMDVSYQFFNRLSIHGMVGTNLMAPKSETVNGNYNGSAYVGGGLAYTLYPVKEDDDDIWEIRTFVTTGVAGLKHTDYNVGFYWYPTTNYAVPILA